MSNVFDRFELSGETKAASGVSVLEMTFCKQIILHHGGVIKAAYDSCGGIAFAFIIPKLEADDS